MAETKLRTVRCSDDTWKRLRMAALAAGQTLGDYLKTLLDQQERRTNG